MPRLQNQKPAIPGYDDLWEAYDSIWNCLDAVEALLNLPGTSEDPSTAFDHGACRALISDARDILKGAERAWSETVQHDVIATHPPTAGFVRVGTFVIQATGHQAGKALRQRGSDASRAHG